MIAEKLKYFVNESLKSGTISQVFNAAGVVSIYNFGKKFICKNYRTTSVLSVLSKVFERVAHERVFNFMVKIYYSTQDNLDSDRNSAPSTLSLILQK